MPEINDELSEMKMDYKRSKSSIMDKLKAMPHTTVCILGETGMGKSALVEDLRKELAAENNVPLEDFGFIDVRASQKEPTDIQGPLIPTAQNRCEYAIPALMPVEANSTAVLLKEKEERIQRKLNAIEKLYSKDSEEYKEVATKIVLDEEENRIGGLPEYGILFFDEIKHAAPEVLNALYQVLYDRKVGEHNIMKNWYILCASNRDHENAHQGEFPDPLKVRLSFTIMSHSATTSAEYFTMNDAVSNIVPLYLIENPDQLYAPEDSEIGFPCGRTWERVGIELKAMQVTKEDGSWSLPSEYMHNIASHIGISAANKFVGYVKLLEENSIITKHTPEEFLKNPDIIGKIKREEPALCWGLYLKLTGYHDEKLKNALSDPKQEKALYEATQKVTDFFLHKVWDECNDISRLGIRSLIGPSESDRNRMFHQSIKDSDHATKITEHFNLETDDWYM